MTELAGWSDQIRALLDSGSAPVVSSPTVSAPDGVGVIVVPLDGAAKASTLAFLDAFSPRVVVVGTRDDDEDSFDVHLVGSVWVQLLYVTADALARADEQDEDDLRVALTESDRQVITAAIEHLVKTTPLSAHGAQSEAVNSLMIYLTEHHADVAAKLTQYWFLARDYAATLHSALKDEHGAALRTDAEAFAQHIVDTEDLGPTMPRSLIRDRVYASLKRQDPTCVTRSAIEGVVFEVGNLIMRAR